MIQFLKEVNLNNRQEMIDFLMHHFRYNTMNSWNRSTSYANNVKIYNLGYTKEIEDKLWDLLDVDDSYLSDEFCFLFDDFYQETGYAAGFNGRSNGYIVLYKAKRQGEKMYIYSGKDIDQNEDFSDEDNWPDSELQERVKLVQRFDQLCDDIIGTAVYYAENYEIIEEEYTVVKKRKVLREITG